VAKSQDRLIQKSIGPGGHCLKDKFSILNLKPRFKIVSDWNLDTCCWPEWSTKETENSQAILTILFHQKLS